MTANGGATRFEQ